MDTTPSTITDGYAFQREYFQRHRDLWQLTELYDTLPNVCFFAKDRHSRFVRMNPTNLELYGFSDEAEILGKTDRDVSPPSLAEAYLADDLRVFKEKGVSAKRVWLSPVGEGLLQWFACCKRVITDQSGEIDGIAGVMHPVKTPDEHLNHYQRVAPAVRRLEAHYNDSTALSEIARLCDLSLPHFNRLFKQAFKITPSEYRTALRVQRARLLLKTTDEPILAVAVDAGFCDHSHLTKHFRKATGMTPLAYRRQAAAALNALASKKAP